MFFFCFLSFFPNRSLLLGFSWRSKRGLPENTHKACSGHCGRPARDRKGTLKKSVLAAVFRFVNVKSVVGENFSRFLSSRWLLHAFSYCLKMLPEKMFLHLIFARVFSFKHFGWLQKTFLLIDLRPCFHFDDLLERCSIHLHYESNQSIE